jgi:hypothetical protein
MGVLKNALLISCILFLLLFMFVLIGYAITLVCGVSLLAIVVLIVIGRDDIKGVLSKNINRNSLIALSVILLFFLVFSIFFLKRTELIFFDEQIYQSIAVNILNHGNALMCGFGTAQLKACYLNSIGFDPAGWPFLIALGFWLFGVGASTAHNLELLLAAVSIVLVFLLSSVLTRKREIPIMAAAIFALIPELFIWSKTQANPNIPFMTFALMSMFFFVLFERKNTKFTLMLSAFGLIFTIYLRVEALLLIPIFAVIFFTFGKKGVKDTFKGRMRSFQDKSTAGKAVLLLAMILLLIAPEILVIVATRPELLQNAIPFLGPSTKIFSLSYFPVNFLQDIVFFSGSVREYPIIFLPEIMVFAIMGVAALALYGKKRRGEGSLGVLLLLLFTFWGYFVFYSVYFSGSALSGGGVRFMLIVYPALSILAAFGVYGLSNWISALAAGKGKSARNRAMVLRYCACIALISVFFVLPFLYAVPFLRHPNYNYADFPIVPSTTPQNDAYSMMYANRSLRFIDSNYELVPQSCLVFSPSPYLWYGLNRASAEIYEYNESIPGLRNYSCFDLDYSYFCTISPDNATVCNAFLTKYKLKVLATESGGPGSNFSLYQILNYTPP